MKNDSDWLPGVLFFLVPLLIVIGGLIGYKFADLIVRLLGWL